MKLNQLKQAEMTGILCLPGTPNNEKDTSAIIVKNKTVQKTIKIIESQK